MVNRNRHTENLGYFVDVGGLTFFHNGDAGLVAAEDYCRFDLTSARVDVAFLGGVFWSPAQRTLETVRRCLAPAAIVLMHLSRDEKATIGAHLQGLDATFPIIVPGAPMTEVSSPRSPWRYPG